jgi:penicillin-binding protein 2
MGQMQSIKDTHAEQRLFVRRLVVALIGIAIFTGVVIARLTQLQVLEYQHFAELSQGNRIRLEAAPPTRGLILDRNGVVLAQNLPAYQLQVIPEQVDDLADTLQRLAQAGLIDPGRVEELTREVRRQPSFRPFVLRNRLDDREVAQFAGQRPYFPGVDIRARLVRDYPRGRAAAHSIGYVGGLSQADLNRVDGANYAGTLQIGKTGIEAAYEDQLHGTVGHDEVVTNAEGRPISSAARSEPVPGQNVYLTIDIEMQELAERLLDGRRGSVVALEPDSGQILAIASTPAYDPNAFASGMVSGEFAALQGDLDRPLFNRSIAGRYPPGSTIKPLLALGALDSGRTSEHQTTTCRGYFSLPGSSHRYRDWKPEGHGIVDLQDAIAQSCDVYFYELAQNMDIDLMHEYLSRFGLGRRLGIEIGGEKAGIVPSREWKRQNFSRRADRIWFPGETVIASIGQGYMLATPLQLAHAAATIALRGRRMQPHLTLSFEDPLSGERTAYAAEALPPVVVRHEHDWDVTIEAMNAVMQTPRGTAYGVGRNTGYPIAGKSGTAQVVSIAQEEEYDEDELDERLKDHALFIAFAPLESPAIAVAVIIENGSSGSSVAAPVARALTDLWLEKHDAL